VSRKKSWKKKSGSVAGNLQRKKASIVAVIVATVEADQTESTRMFYDDTTESLTAVIIIAILNSA
jgi:hypothetical protein